MRKIILGVSVAILLGIVAAVLILGKAAHQTLPSTNLLLTKFEDPELQPTATANERIRLADNIIEQLISLYPDDAAVYDIRADRLNLSSDIVAVEANWLKALSLEPKFSDALFGLAEIANSRGEYEKAISYCEAIPRNYGAYARVVLLLADSLMENGQAQRAALTLQRHLAEDHASVQALLLLGTIHLNSGELEEAIVAFSKVLEFAPDSKGAYYGLTQAHARLGNKELAQEFKRLHASAKPLNAEGGSTSDSYSVETLARVYADSALIHQRHGELAKAQEYLLRALYLQPNDIKWLTDLQRVLVLRRLQPEAIEVGERLAKLTPNDVDVLLNLGELYAEVERFDQSIAVYERAIEVAPHDIRCKKASAVIRQMGLH